MNSAVSGRELRVAIVIDQLAVAGSEIQMLRLSQGLRALGHHVDILVLGSIANSSDVEVLRTASAGVAIHPSDRGQARTAWAIIRYLRLSRPDIIYGVMTRSSALVTISRPALGKSRVLVAQRYMLGEVSGWRWLVRRLPQVLADGVVTNSAAAAKEFRQRPLTRRKPICVVQNALSDAALEVVQPLSTDSTLPVVACLANLRSPKGHTCLLEAAALLERRGRPVVLSLVGSGELEDELRRYASQLGVDVRWMGRVEDPRGILASADIVVQASHSEGMPNAVLEAMAQGKPVVATDVGGTGEILTGVGLLVRAGSPKALADGIEYLLSNPAEAQRMGKKARDRAKHFSVAAAAQGHLDCFAKTLEGRK